MATIKLQHLCFEATNFGNCILYKFTSVRVHARVYTISQQIVGHNISLPCGVTVYVQLSLAIKLVKLLNGSYYERTMQLTRKYSLFSASFFSQHQTTNCYKARLTLKKVSSVHGLHCALVCIGSCTDCFLQQYMSCHVMTLLIQLTQKNHKNAIK